MARRKVDGPIFTLPPFEVKAYPLAAGQKIDWGLELFGVPELWKHDRGEDDKIAVLDTGCALQHPDLEPAVDEAKDFTGSPAGPHDVNGHGTHCAGTIGARDNTEGVVGVAPKCRLLIGKVLGDGGTGNSRDIAKGIVWAVEKGATIISMSLGSPVPDRRIKEAVDHALSRGVVVIAAAGNEGPGPDTSGYPASWEGVVSVGAVDRGRKLARFSSRGKVDICAPGDDILSCYPPRGLAVLSGTSMATPFVAGVVALIKGQKGPGIVLERLKATATDAGLPGRDSAYGWGLIDPAKLAAGAAEIPPPPAGGIALRLDRADFTVAGMEKLRRAGIGTVSINL
jgi:subtilisin